MDQYECTRGNKAVIPYRKTIHDKDGNYKKVYRSGNSKPQYDAMHEKLQTEYAKRIMKKRGSTVEPVIGTMLNFTNLKRVNTRGIKAANKHPSTMLRISVLLSALAYNLKKYLKFKPKKVQEATQILPKEEKGAAFLQQLLSKLKQATFC